MFGIGFTELILISILAILFLGPDKLPETMVQIAKFIKSVKQTVGDAKSTLEEEMKIADLKEEALSYKKQLDSASSELRSFKNIDYNDIIGEGKSKVVPAKEKSDESDNKSDVNTPEVEQKSEAVTYKRKSRKKKLEETPVATVEEPKKADKIGKFEVIDEKKEGEA